MGIVKKYHTFGVDDILTDSIDIPLEPKYPISIETIPRNYFDRKTFPNEISYEGMLADVHDQVRDKKDTGTCYAEAATAWMEYLIWRKTGKKISFTTEEIFDVAADSKGYCTYDYRKENKSKSIYSGMPRPVITSAYNYNDNLENHYFSNKQFSEHFQLFRDVIDDSLTEDKFIVYGLTNYTKFSDVETAYKTMLNILTTFGPFCILVYNNIIRSSLHCMLACAADENGLYMRNSYGDPTLCLMMWDMVVKLLYKSDNNVVSKLRI